jgi:NADH-quinone oxidoreductase subunit C
MVTAELVEELKGLGLEAYEARGEVTVVAPAEDLLGTLRSVREHAHGSFDFLADLTCSDWPGSDPRFWVAYHLLSIEHQHRMRVKVGLSLEPDGGEPHISSVTSLFPGANWLEREVFDFFGVIFDGHPDLRRIEMPEDWVGYPLRKDEPLAGVRTQYKGAFIPPPDEREL